MSRPHRGRASFANSQNFGELGLRQCPSERRGEEVPVRSLRVPSHVPSHPQTAAKVRGFWPTASGFAAETDCLLEEAGFELLVPPAGAGPYILGLGFGAGRFHRFAESHGGRGSRGQAGIPRPSQVGGFGAVALAQGSGQV
jgi:hypothetical protein